MPKEIVLPQVTAYEVVPSSLQSAVSRINLDDLNYWSSRVAAVGVKALTTGCGQEECYACMEMECAELDFFHWCVIKMAIDDLGTEKAHFAMKVLRHYGREIVFDQISSDYDVLVQTESFISFLNWEGKKFLVKI